MICASPVTLVSISAVIGRVHVSGTRPNGLISKEGNITVLKLFYEPQIVNFSVLVSGHIVLGYSSRGLQIHAINYARLLFI